MWAARALVRLARAEQAVNRTMGRGVRFMAGYVWASSSSTALTQVSVAINGEGTAPPPDAGLFPWERPWFEAELPAPPALLLVGGAGRGREVVALQRLGYVVHAYEPSSAFGELEVVCEDSCWHLSHQAVATGAGPDEAYDAVLLGWGSLSHMVDPSERAGLIRRADALCPRGPILASFVRRHGRSRSSHALATGAAVASRLGMARRTVPPELQFAPRAGFMTRLDDAEINQLGARVGRQARVEGISPGRATWHADG